MDTKKIFGVLGLIILLNTNIQAQNLKFGFTSGLDITSNKLSTKPNRINTGNDPFPIVAFNINGVISFKGQKFWGISIEPGFIRKGWKTRGNYYEQKIQLNYIQMPILFDIYVTERIIISTGTEANYLVKGKTKTTTETIEEIRNDTDVFKNFELSGLIGIAYKINKNLDLRLRYSHGLTTAIKKYSISDEYNDIINKINYHNQYLQLSLKIEI